MRAEPMVKVSEDGSKFLLSERVGEHRDRAIHVVENWFAEFGTGR